MKYIRNALFQSVLACCTLPAHADTVLCCADINAPILSAKSVVGELTGGAEMTGMQVTVNFVGGGTSAGTWATNVTGCTQAADCGNATGTIGNGNWTLTESGNTGSVTDIHNPDRTALNPWTLTNTSTDHAIASVVLNGIPSHKVFDRDLHSDGQARPAHIKPVFPSGLRRGSRRSSRRFAFCRGCFLSSGDALIA